MKIANVIMADSWGDVTPEALERGIGGREGAMIYLSREWAKLGHQVTNFVPTEKGKRFEETRLVDKSLPGESSLMVDILSGFHEYVPLNLCKPMLANFPWDAVVAWECPKEVFEDPRVRENIKVKVCEMQVAHFSFGQMEAAEQYCDYVAALSDWHGEFMLHSGLDMPRDRVVTLPNGADLSRYPFNKVVQKIHGGPRHGLKGTEQPRFVYSSSPDRGLWHLLRAWPHIRHEWPLAQLYVAYGVERWTSQVRWMHNRQGEMAVELERLMRQTGVVDMGKVGQSDLAKLQLKADAWLYPLDSIQATETGCITAVENAAAGNPIITTDADCMEEEFGRVGMIQELPFDARAFADATIELLQDSEGWRSMATKGREFAETRDWSKIAPRWIELFQKSV